jgi:hypothetical protein
MSTPSGWNNVGGSPLSRSSYEPMRFGASYLSTPNNNSNYTVNFSSGGMSGALIEVLSEKVSPVPSFIRPS